MLPGIVSAGVGGLIFGLSAAGAFMFITMAITFAWIALSIRAAKRQKPRGFYIQRLNKALSRAIPKALPIINYEGHWETRRQIVRGEEGE